MARPNPLVVATGVVAALLLLAEVGAQIALADLSQQPACPPYPRVIHAEGVHFTPGVVEHRSWVEFSTPPTITGYFAFCLDGLLLEHGGGQDLDLSGGHARFNVSTTWVDIVWFRGKLGSYADLQRWELRLLCAVPPTC